MPAPSTLFYDPRGARLAIAAYANPAPNVLREAGLIESATLTLNGTRAEYMDWDEDGCQVYSASEKTDLMSGTLVLAMKNAAAAANVALVLRGALTAAAGGAAISVTTDAEPSVGDIIDLQRPATGDVTVTPATGTATKGTHWEYTNAHQAMVRVLSLTDLTGAWSITGTDAAHNTATVLASPDARYFLRIELSNPAAASCGKLGFMFWRARLSDGYAHTVSQELATTDPVNLEASFDVLVDPNVTAASGLGKLGRAILPA